jgi:transposase InsO family protein
VGKVHCCAILDTYSRRVVGWSIDASPTGALVTNAFGMAIDSRLGEAACFLFRCHSFFHSVDDVQGVIGIDFSLEVADPRWVH